MFSEIISFVSDFMYGKMLIVLLLFAGLYFTVRGRFVQFRMMKQAVLSLMDKPADNEGKVSSFQALMVSTASRVGTGSIYCNLPWRVWLGFLDVDYRDHWQRVGICGKYAGADL